MEQTGNQVMHDQMYSQVGPLSDLECIKGRDTCLVCLSQPANVKVNRRHKFLVMVIFMQEKKDMQPISVLV